MKYDQQKQERRLASVYVGVVGGETDIHAARTSIHNIQLRTGDHPPLWKIGTKGYETREWHINNFLENTSHGAILLLDHDQEFAPGTLSALRGHGMPYVTGLYMRRHYNPIAPVWFEDMGSKPTWDTMPMMKLPPTHTPRWASWGQQGGGDPVPRLVKLGGSGWGCVLIHREVFEAMRPILKNEPWVIEDDMDVYPYDVMRLMKARNALVGLTASLDLREREDWRAAYLQAVQVLVEELRPLRLDTEPVGSDVRFPFYAKTAGYQLYGDPMVRAGHFINYPLHPDDYLGGGEKQTEVIKELEERVRRRRKEWRARMREIEGKK